MALGLAAAVCLGGAPPEDVLPVEVDDPGAVEVPGESEEPAAEVRAAEASSLPPPPELASRAQVLAALGHARHQHNLRSGLVLAGMAVAEVGAGFLLVGGTRSDDVGIALSAVGALHGLDAGLQLDVSRRRRAAFLASLAIRQERGPEAVGALIRRERLAAERQARGHALLTGLFVGVLGGGVGLVVTDEESEGALGPGGAVAFGGAVGALHHWLRWRQAVRYSVDLDTLGLGVPTVLEPGG